MSHKINNYEFELLYVIVNSGLGSKVINLAKDFGIMGGTILLGKGTIKNPLLEFLELAKSNKEIVLIVAEKKQLWAFLDSINEEFEFRKKNHGIAFCMPLKNVIGNINHDTEEYKEIEGTVKNMYNSIFVVVEKGNGASVVDTANRVGARGATIINARGSSTKETQKIFSIEIEPEKEIVLILAETNVVNDICEKVNEELQIGTPGKGIIFVQEVSKFYGLDENKKVEKTV